MKNVKTNQTNRFYKSLFIAFALLSVASFYTSCQEDEALESITPETTELTTENQIADVEEAYPDQTGRPQELYYGLNKLNVLNYDGEYIFEGDMRFKPEHLQSELSEDIRSVGRTGGRWPNNVVYYAINPNLPNQSRVMNAIANWEANTSVRFEVRTNQSDYIYFTPGSGCSSYVGRIGGRQNITLASGCSTGSTIHEIGHAVGLWHEQSRADRDNYITILTQNIQSGVEYNFLTYVQQGQDGDEYTAALDFDSVMLYSSYAFSKNGQPTIVKNNGATYTTNRTGLSTGDIEGINQMYPGDGGSGGGGSICDGVSDWSNSQYYSVGDRVVYQGKLYERVSGGWIFIGECPETTSICDGVAPYSSTTSYQAGDQVTYNGYLYERTNTGWIQLGACN